MTEQYATVRLNSPTHVKANAMTHNMFAWTLAQCEMARWFDFWNGNFLPMDLHQFKVWQSIQIEYDTDMWTLYQRPNNRVTKQTNKSIFKLLAILCIYIVEPWALNLNNLMQCIVMPCPNNPIDSLRQKNIWTHKYEYASKYLPISSKYSCFWPYTAMMRRFWCNMNLLFKLILWI